MAAITPDPPPAQPGPGLLRQETGRGQDRQRGAALAEAAGQQRHLRVPAGRRPAGRGARRGPGRATGERLCRQRGRLTPRAPALRTSHSRARPPPYDRSRQHSARPCPRPGQRRPFPGRCHPATGDAAGPGGAPAAKRGRTTWRCGNTTATLGREDGPGSKITAKATAPEGHFAGREEHRRSHLTQRGFDLVGSGSRLGHMGGDTDPARLLVRTALQGSLLRPPIRRGGSCQAGNRGRQPMAAGVHGRGSEGDDMSDMRPALDEASSGWRRPASSRRTASSTMEPWPARRWPCSTAPTPSTTGCAGPSGQAQRRSTRWPGQFRVTASVRLLPSAPGVGRLLNAGH